MPRVTEEYRQKQADRIATAAEICFARNGFHATSMDQIIDEVGMSSSTVYRYFDGKQQIIQEVSRRRISPIIDALRDAVSAERPPHPEDVIEGIVTGLYPWHPTDDRRARETSSPAVSPAPSAVLAVNAWAETARDDILATTIRDNLTEIHHLATELIGRWQNAGYITNARDAGDLAHILQQNLFGQIATITVTGSAAPPSLTPLLALLTPGPVHESR